ncbi:MAG TPA: type II toxin-antitoxin system VapC family toxin [Opitutaceae bacterium]|nr:type II toxin-antitoxin system VapC family toxin [Opitutaceae bacterium]HND62429.1 type II toxin-antitoxin system VapC family toxin [Opitutaceae bacterium]
MARLRYLLDTHVLIWAAVERHRLGAGAARLFRSARLDEMAVSDVSLQEIGLLVHAGKVVFRDSPQRSLAGLLAGVTVIPIDLDAAVIAPALAMNHADPFDRMITATAKVRGLTLVTRDANISDSGLVPTLW